MKQQVVLKMESRLAPHGPMFRRTGLVQNVVQEKMTLK